MSGPPADKTERLLEGDATDFERRILEAALRQRPSRDSTARMAKALGVTAAALGTATPTTTAAAGATAASATVVWPWVSAGVVGLVVAVAVVAPRVARDTGEPRPVVRPPAAAPAPRVVEPTVPVQPPAVVAEPERRPAAPSQRARPAAPTAAGELREQVALLDSARQAMSAGASDRALESLRRYLDRYPAGTFRPEAIALEVEALMKLGRDAEARALAQRFIADHPGSLLARRVADVAGLKER